MVSSLPSPDARLRANEQRREELRAALPIGRVVGPADVAALAVHIMSNAALSGATYHGGQQLEVARKAE